MECNQDGVNLVANYLEGGAMPRFFDESSSDDPILDPKHKIFLSHSGAQKEFVEHLCKALEDRWHYPFFDRRPESLPKGERFLELIIQAAQQCEMLIVVVSNEYFMSKWPMMELNAFVKAHELNHRAKCPQGGPRILPLFYGLSLRDLEDEAMQKNWFESWEHLAEVDSKKRIVVSDWKYALDVLRSFNGLEYNKQMKEIVAYEDEIVNHVCKSIVPDLKWDDSHVQGKSSICKAIGEKIGSMRVSKKYHIKVVGIHGVGGIGKTTTCKTLSNELLREYEGRVCHLEFQSDPSKDSIEILRKALVDLTRKSTTMIQLLNEGECKHALRTSLSKQKVFLAIDNVSDDHESMKHAKMFLEAPCHKESLVIVTARSKSILERLGIDGDACVEMPELEEVDAMKLFLHHAAQGKEFLKDEDKGHILKCIQRCYFSKGDGVNYGYHYHPLALEALGLQLGYYGENPSEWMKNLPKVRNFSSLSRTNPVFDILRSNFDLLPSSEQNLFMDVGLFEHRGRYSFFDDVGCEFIEISSIEWLCDLHKEDDDEIQHRLENLKRKGLLQDVDLRNGRINMHDLYIEFAELEAKGSFNELGDLEKQTWVYVDNGNLTKLEKTPEGRCWSKLIRLAIAQPYLAAKKQCQIIGQIASLEGIQWDHFSNVEVLHLEGLHWGRGTFNVKCLMALRYLYLLNTIELGSLEGLGKLKNLTQFSWTSMTKGSHFVGQLPSSLKTLYISGGVVILGSNLLAQCHNLSKLSLYEVEVSTLDLSNCESLESVFLDEISKLQTLSGFSTCRPSSLQSLSVDECIDLVDILGMDYLIGLKELWIQRCSKLEVQRLFAITELPDLEIKGEVQNLVVHRQDSIPRQLQELSFSFGHSVVGVHLDGFNQLEVLNLRSSDGLMSLEGVGELPALRCLNLIDCKNLLRLPYLSKSKNLEDLDLTGCYTLELHEKDIQMLSELPLLQPVPFSGEIESSNIRLDFVRWRALIHSCKKRHCGGSHSWLHWKEHEWEERDLGSPPLKIAKHGPI